MQAAVLTPSQAARDFRWVLRDATRPQHDALDQMITGLDLRIKDDLLSFLRMNLIGFRGMAATQDHPALARMITALKADLRVLDFDTDLIPPMQIAPYDPLAGAYMISGSRMGTMVLRKRWAKATDPLVQAADHYFTADYAGPVWADVCDDLNHVPAGSPRADRIIHDTSCLFDAFAKACSR